MSLLSICQSVTKSVGVATPSSVFGNTKRTTIVLLEMANQTGEEMARRVDWGKLTKSATLTGDGTNLKHALPSDFSRVVKGVGVQVNGVTVRPLTRAEWGTLTPSEGVPRYYLLEGAGITLWPYLANGDTITVSYQSKNWCDNGSSEFMADDDASLIDEKLFAKGVEVRWRREQGMPYADQEAEYEAALQDFAMFDDRSRI